MNLDFDLCWQKIKIGDLGGLEEIHKASFRTLVFYACEITGQQHLAEEIVQDVFLKIWQNSASITVSGSFRAYLFAMVHNHALNMLRQQKTRKESVNRLGSEQTWQFISDTYHLNDNLIEKIYSDETEAKISGIIERLSDQCRKVFILSRGKSLKNEEIAALLGISEHTVKTHIYRALQKISSALKNEMQ
jgi:RNA polymerase sigma-70 factor (ECF subfamily)